MNEQYEGRTNAGRSCDITTPPAGWAKSRGYEIDGSQIKMDATSGAAWASAPADAQWAAQHAFMFKIADRRSRAYQGVVMINRGVEKAAGVVPVSVHGHSYIAPKAGGTKPLPANSVFNEPRCGAYGDPFAPLPDGEAIELPVMVASTKVVHVITRAPVMRKKAPVPVVSLSQSVAMWTPGKAPLAQPVTVKVVYRRVIVDGLNVPDLASSAYFSNLRHFGHDGTGLDGYELAPLGRGGVVKSEDASVESDGGLSGVNGAWQGPYPFFGSVGGPSIGDVYATPGVCVVCGAAFTVNATGPAQVRCRQHARVERVRLVAFAPVLYREVFTVISNSSDIDPDGDGGDAYEVQIAAAAPGKELEPAVGIAFDPQANAAATRMLRHGVPTVPTVPEPFAPSVMVLVRAAEAVGQAYADRARAEATRRVLALAA